MPDPQPQKVLAPLTPAAIFLVATIDEGGEDIVHDALGDVSGLVRAIGFRDPSKRLSAVTSIGAEAFDRLFSGPRPAELHPFVALDGPRHHAPSTPGDLLFHLRAESLDVCFELAQKILEAMSGAITVIDEVHGFKFFDNRDLMGFVDGTENPDGPIAVSATQIGDEDPDFAGGCYVHVQKYLHDLGAWNALTTEAQEAVIGRTKLDDIELSDDVKPANSHLALNVIEDADGNELKILRHNMPFGEVGKAEFGTYYIGYSRTPDGDRADAAQHVHRRSAGQHRPDPGLLHRGHRVAVLHPDRGLPRRPAGAARRRVAHFASPSQDSSLSIGSLKGRPQ